MTNHLCEFGLKKQQEKHSDRGSFISMSGNELMVSAEGTVIIILYQSFGPESNRITAYSSCFISKPTLVVLWPVAL